jgi:hypothetical protein
MASSRLEAAPTKMITGMLILGSCLMRESNIENGIKGRAHMLRDNQTPRKLRTLHFVTCFIGLLLIMGIGNGCGKDDKPDSKNSAESKVLQACELLTKAEIEAIFGETVEEPRQTFKENQKQQFWMSTCDYYSPAKSQRAGILIKNSQNADPAKAFEAHTASLKKTLGENYSMQAIAGIGSHAAWDGSVKQLTVFEGPRMFIVTTGRPGENEETALETAKTIAAKVLSKLPR